MAGTRMKINAFDCLRMGIRPEPGWEGAFTRNRHPGAMPSGTRIVKSVHESGDMVPVGTVGTVLGSIGTPDMTGYFVAWDSHPHRAVFLAGFKIAKAE